MLAPWKKSYDQPRQHVKKQRHYLPTKVCLFKAMVFPVVMYARECWIIKKVECCRIDAFELCCWRILLRVPWTTRRSNQSILKEIILNIHLKDWCWRWNSNTLATWCGKRTQWKRPRCWERLKAGEGDRRGWDEWMASPTQWTWVGANSGRWWWTGRPPCCHPWGCKESDMTEQLNWTELDWFKHFSPWGKWERSGFCTCCLEHIVDVIPSPPSQRPVRPSFILQEATGPGNAWKLVLPFP